MLACSFFARGKQLVLHNTKLFLPCRRFNTMSPWPFLAFFWPFFHSRPIPSLLINLTKFAWWCNVASELRLAMQASSGLQGPRRLGSEPVFSAVLCQHVMYRDICLACFFRETLAFGKSHYLFTKLAYRHPGFCR